MPILKRTRLRPQVVTSEEIARAMADSGPASDSKADKLQYRRVTDAVADSLIKRFALTKGMNLYPGEYFVVGGPGKERISQTVYDTWPSHPEIGSSSSPLKRADIFQREEFMQRLPALIEDLQRRPTPEQMQQQRQQREHEARQQRMQQAQQRMQQAKKAGNDLGIGG